MNSIVCTPAQQHSFTFLSELIASPDVGILWHNGEWQRTNVTPVNGSRLVVSAQALTLHQLQGIAGELKSTMTLSAFQANRFSQQFGETVVTAQAKVSDDEHLKTTLATLSSRYDVDIALVDDAPELSQPGLLVMDMDSTVIQIECIDEIAKLAGVGEQVAEVTARAMRGELVFSESLISRVACLDGVEESKLAAIRDSIPLMPGLMNLLTVLKQHNWKIAIASGGFTYFADYLQTRLGLDAVRANVLEVIDGKLTGKVLGDIVDAQVKAQTVVTLAKEYGISSSQTVAMGDGANDLVMMAQSKLGVACHAKPVVNAQADVAVRLGGLHTMLYYLA